MCSTSAMTDDIVLCVNAAFRLFQNCEVVPSSCETETSPMQCRHVTANYYVNPPWSTPTQRLLPCPPLPSAPLPSPPGAAAPPSVAVYCPMDGTVRRLDRASPPTVSVPSPDDTSAAAYVPMDVYNHVATGSTFPQTGSDVIDDCARVDDNIYEPLNDVSWFEQGEE